MKKGFTLVELLVAIAIMSILAVIAVPKALEIFNDTRKSTFITDVHNIYKAAELDWQMDNAKGNRVKEYNNTTTKVQTDIPDDYIYCVKMNGYGEVKKIIVDNGRFHVESTDKMNTITIDSVTESTGEAICTSEVTE